MKKRITLGVVIALLCFYSNQQFAQCDIQRQLVNDLDPDDQCELRNLMLDYLKIGYDPNGGPNDWNDYPNVDMHFNPPFGSFSNFHNYAEEFATWHRNYIQGMEEYILTRGFPQYVPLPYWTPHELIPDAFYNYSCPDENGDLTYANLPESTDFPQYINGQGPFNSHNGSVIIDFHEFDENFDCSNYSDVDDFVGQMEGINWPNNGNHDAVHGAVGGTLGPPPSASASTLFWLFHAYITDLHSCYLRECDGKEADIYVRDNAPDDGSEPTNQQSELWTSPDIWVRNQPDGFDNTSVEKLCFKINDEDEVRPVYIYVRTWNRGEVPSKNNENDLNVYWAKPSAGLSWPAPWNGQPTSNSCGLPVGGFVGSQALRSVNGQYLDEFDIDRDGDNTEVIEGYTIYEFEWLPPDPTIYVDCFGDGWEKGHFCIHARVDDGDSWNMTGSFYSDLVMNNDFALKNIYIYGEDDENELCDNIEWLVPPGGDCVFFGNYTDQVLQNVALELSFPTVEDQELLTNNEINITLKDGGMQRWVEGGKTRTGVDFIEGNDFVTFTGVNGRIDGMTLQPMEVHRFCLEIIGDPVLTDGKDLTLDVVQKVDGKEVGGERFIVRKVIPAIEFKQAKLNSGSVVNHQFSIYPNPAGEQVTIRLKDNSILYDIRIYNAIGQTISIKENINEELTITTNKLGKGLFIVEVKNPSTGESQIQKVVIE